MVNNYSFNHGAGMVQVVRRKNGGWAFTFQNRTFGEWETAKSAVRDICGRQTGNEYWDTREDARDVPASLEDWYPAPVRVRPPG